MDSSFTIALLLASASGLVLPAPRVMGAARASGRIVMMTDEPEKDPFDMGLLKCGFQPCTPLFVSKTLTLMTARACDQVTKVDHARAC